MKCSDQQQAAIDARGQTLLVAAAAGSGKTSVLVERIIRRILNPAERLSVDRLLVVTFTNAAAAEMRHRIGEALAAALRDGSVSDPDTRRHVERQQVLLNAAAISTLHAFCQSVIRQYFYRLESADGLALDPAFRVAAQAETDLLQSDALDRVLEKDYENGDPEFLQLVDHYGGEAGDGELRELVLRLYAFSCSHPWPHYWLAGLANPLAIPAATEFSATVWAQILLDRIKLELDQSVRELENLSREAVRPGNPAAYNQTFAEDLQVLAELRRAADHSWQELRQALDNHVFSRIASVGKEVADAVKKRFQEGRNRVKARVKRLQTDYFDRSDAELADDLRQSAPVVAALAALTQRFAVAYTAAKRAKGLVDFNDLEHFCLAVLREPGSTPDAAAPSAAARELRQRFAEIMVDEYQDTNRVQEEILQLVADPEQPNLFMVGDVKQSIYRFRLAEPALFLEKYHTFPVTDGQRQRRIDLSQNFRSRPGILAAVNFLFAQLMSQQAAELDYGEAEQLNPGPDYPASEQPTLEEPVEFHLIDRTATLTEERGEDGEVAAAEEETVSGNTAELAVQEELTGFELEVGLITRRIQELLAGNQQVFDKDSRSYRPLICRDIVVLLRTVRGKAQLLVDALRQGGIPCYAEVESGYFQETEVGVMLALMSVIDNPRQDIPLAAVLRSPLAGLDSQQLAQLRLGNRAGALWDAVQAALAPETMKESPEYSRLETFLRHLSDWRDLARSRSVAELIWQIFRDTGYYEYVGGMPGGGLRQANLRALYDRARQYEATNFRGLFRFLRFVEKMQEKGSDLAVARALGEGEDVVRVMSIHKSKGLEFPVVFVADLGKQINFQDTRSLLLCHKELGAGPYVTMPELRFRYPTPARRAIAHRLEMETRAEELRILYVAFTRAREKLILVGSGSELAKKCEGWGREVGAPDLPLPVSLVAKARSYLDWLAPAVARHPGGEAFRMYGDCDTPVAGAAAEHPSRWQTQVWPAAEITPAVMETATLAGLEQLSALAPVAAAGDIAAVDAVLGWQYPCGNAAGKPAKLAVSEIKRRLDLWERTGEAELLHAEPAAPVLTRPRFVQRSSRLSAVEYGVAVHAMMQYADLNGELSTAGLQRQMEEMVAADKLTPEQVAAIDTASVALFFDAPLGRRLLASSQAWRELPFSLMLGAENFYPELQGCGEQVFVQGVVDALFAEEDGLVLLDYKTDQSLEGLTEKYAVQLTLYAEAVERIMGQPVKECYLYAFRHGQVLPVPRRHGSLAGG
ncbi:MAG TPA: helicase-exonuclease AddAB subunit AddA [Patescibacteria group bacterium]|nr:helicase-exonuclease AddAB subunit AddA [Patescibacteria group bacterium]